MDTFDVIAETLHVAAVVSRARSEDEQTRLLMGEIQRIADSFCAERDEARAALEKAEDRVAELETRTKLYAEALKGLEKMRLESLHRADGAEAKLAKAQEALALYGEHRSACAKRHGNTKCSCGLDEAFGWVGVKETASKLEPGSDELKPCGPCDGTGCLPALPPDMAPPFCRQCNGTGEVGP